MTEPGYIQQLNTETAYCTRLVVAHNAVLTFMTMNGGGPDMNTVEAAAQKYVELMKKIMAGVS